MEERNEAREAELDRLAGLYGAVEEARAEEADVLADADDFGDSEGFSEYLANVTGARERAEAVLHKAVVGNDIDKAEPFETNGYVRELADITGRSLHSVAFFAYVVKTVGDDDTFSAFEQYTVATPEDIGLDSLADFGE